MKKYFLITFGLCIAVALLILTNDRKLETSSTQNEIPPSSALKRTAASAAEKNSSDDFGLSGAAAEKSANAEFTAPRLIPVSAVQTIVQSGQEFNWGEFSNTVVKTHLQLAPNATKEPSQDGSKISGTYLSRRHLGHQAFDTISIGYSAIVPPESSLKFEIRIMTANNEWSAWQELSPDEFDQPIPMDGLAAGWQYQITFFAPSIDATPEVQRVTITTRNGTPAGLQENVAKNESQ
jgi:hypothetical protein